MKSPAHQIALKIAAAGHGTFAGNSGWSVSVGTAPDSPDDTITVYDTGGNGPDTDELDLLNPFFQVRVRAFEYADAYTKQESIQSTLKAIASEVLDTHRWVFVNVSSDIAHIGNDDSDRVLLVCNYQAMRHVP